MIDTPAQKRYFTDKLMQWHEQDNTRDLPWKAEKDPYKIWLSEIILQQTRAEQGLPYYLSFIEHYPSIKALAAARDEDVFLLWQGLGYYNRCKNMLATARSIVTERKGKFPQTYDDILQLKGIGPYTCAAIASFAYGLPHAVVDGNVYRVLARYFGIKVPSDSTEGKKLFLKLANELLDTGNSALYNQAIMDLGATICTPKLTKCTSCPLSKKCFAYQHELVYQLPVKTKKLVVRERYFNYIFFINNGSIWIRKRTEKDIWQNLYEPYLIESSHILEKKEVNKAASSLNIGDFRLTEEAIVSQKLTHRIIHIRFFVAELGRKYPIKEDGKWVKFNELKTYAFPKSTISFLEKKLYF